MSKRSLAEPVPHSWAIPRWPQHVYPHGPDKARYLVRAHRDELVAAGALTRVGRDLVVLGEPYAAWMRAQASRVAGFEIAPNRRAAAAP